MPTLLRSSLLLTATLLTTLTTASASTPQGHCPGPILANNICCANGYEIDSTTGTARCNAYGTAVLRNVLTSPTSIPIANIPNSAPPTGKQDERERAAAAAIPSNNEGNTPALAAATPTATTNENVLGAGMPAPTPTNLARQYGSIVFPNGYGYGTVAYPEGGVYGNGGYAGYGSYGPNGYSYENPYVTVAGEPGYGEGGYGGREPYYPIGYSAEATYITEGVNGPVTITRTYRAEATGRPGVGVKAGVGMGMGLIGLLVGGLV